MSFIPSKSTVGFFTTNTNVYSYQPCIFLNHQPLSSKRFKILKYISGCDWGSDASNLRNTYIALVRPILEYGFPIYCCASSSNLQKLERTQLSAARIIIGLRHSCPCEIVLYETDLQPLSLRRKAIMIKYYRKLQSFGSQIRTSVLLLGLCIIFKDWKEIAHLQGSKLAVVRWSGTTKNSNGPA